MLSVARYIIPKDALKKVREHKKGSFADVWIGKLNEETVAIKEFYLKSLPPHLITEFDPYYTTSFNNAHKHIVNFFGIYDQPGKFAMVMEFIPFSLTLFYEAYHLSLQNIYNFGEQLATGLEFLHSKGYGHKHLKSNNVFVTPNLIIKIGDFGLSRLKMESSSDGAARAEATVRWRAPETFTRDFARTRDNFEVQKPSDMYSYGLVLWEMATRRKPFKDQSEVKVVELLTAGTREEIDVKWPEHFKTLLLNLWMKAPSSRPTAEQVIQTFQAPEFAIAEARRAPVLGYQQTGVDGIPVICESQGYNIPNDVAKEMQILNKNHTATATVIPPEVKYVTLIELCKVGQMNRNTWDKEINRLDKDGLLPDLLNAAGVLEFTSFFELGCMFVAEKLRLEMMKPQKEERRTKLLLPEDEERSQNEFEQLLLAAIRAKKVGKTESSSILTKLFSSSLPPFSIFLSLFLPIKIYFQLLETTPNPDLFEFFQYAQNAEKRKPW